MVQVNFDISLPVLLSSLVTVLLLGVLCLTYASYVKFQAYRKSLERQLFLQNLGIMASSTLLGAMGMWTFFKQRTIFSRITNSLDNIMSNINNAALIAVNTIPPAPPTSIYWNDKIKNIFTILTVTLISSTMKKFIERTRVLPPLIPPPIQPPIRAEGVVVPPVVPPIAIPVAPAVVVPVPPVAPPIVIPFPVIEVIGAAVVAACEEAIGQREVPIPIPVLAA